MANIRNDELLFFRVYDQYMTSVKSSDLTFLGHQGLKFEVARGAQNVSKRLPN